MSLLGQVGFFLTRFAVLAYATWNSGAKWSSITLSNGDLTAASTGTGGGMCKATIGKTSGKWYFEVIVGATSSQLTIGVANTTESVGTAFYPGGTANSVGYYQGGTVYYNSGSLGSNASYTTGDVIGVAYDLAGNVAFYKNNTLQSISHGVPTGAIFPVIGSLTGTADYIATANFGATGFAYVPPSGYAGVSN